MKTYTFSGRHLGLLTLSFLFILLLFSMSNMSAQQQVVLPADGSFSQENSPQGGLHVQRQLYLITPDEMAASGLLSGVDINSIGFTIAAAQDTTTIGAFKLYLQNTTDVESRTDTIWSTTTSSTNSVALTGLPTGEYEWQVQAACSGNSAFSSSRDFSNADISGCNHPINLTVSAITDVSATLNWYAPQSSNFVEYKVEYTPVNTNNWTSAVTSSTSLNISGLSPSTNYQWRVRTICASDSSEINNSQFTTLNENNCNAPSVLVASNPTGTTMDLSWTAASGAIRYDIQFRRTGTSQWLSTISFSNTLTLNFGLVAGTTYEWSVRTVCTAGKGAHISGPDFTTTGTTVCYVPTNLYTDNISETTATLHWTESVSATSYNIRYRLKNAISWANAIAPMDTVHNDSILIPSEIGPFSIPFSMGSPFVYTGGGIYIAFEYENDTAQLSTLNNALATKQNTSILNQYGSDSILIVLCLDGKTESSDLVLPEILTTTKLRPQTSFGSTTFIDSVAVEAVYALGQYALGYSEGAVVSALVTNLSSDERTYQINFDVIDELNSALVYNSSQSVTILGDTSVLVSFSGYTPTTEGTYSLEISVDAAPTENALSNNSANYLQTVTTSTIAYDDGSMHVTNAGFGEDSGLILARNSIQGCGRVNAASVFLDFSAIGHDLYAVILNSSGLILDSSSVFTPLQNDVNQYQTFYFPKAPFFNNDEFYVGIAQQADPGNPYYPVGVQWETANVRSGAYYRDSIAGTQLTDMPEPGRLMIRSEIIPGSIVPVIEGDLSLCSGETDTLTVASATQSFANEVLSFSSQISNQSYSADKALGYPDVYPLYEANSNAWMSNTADDQREFIELGFSNSAPINYIDIYETFNPGAVDTVYVKNPGTGMFEIVYSGPASAQASEARINRIKFPITSFNVSEIRIALASDVITGYNGIDAVAIGELVSPGSFSSYLWSPNGETTNEIYVTSSGVYSVVVTDGSGCESSASVEVVSPQQTIPVISVAAGSTVFCQGDSVTLISDQPSGNTWSTGETTQSITVNTSSSITVSYDDGTGCGLATSAAVDVIVNPLPTPSITGSLSICPSGSTTLDAGAGYSGYAWSTGATTQTISVSQANTYIVTVEDGNGCSGSTSVTTFISTPPSPVISGNLSFCPGESTVLDAGGGYSGYNWSTGATTQTISVSTATTISVTVTDGNGCTGSTSATTSIYTPPNPSISGDLDFCLGESTLLDAGSGYSDYSWSTGANTQTYLVSAAGTYGVTVTDGNGCTGDANVVVTVNIPPTPVITGSFSFCGGASTTLDAGAGYNSYSWSTGEISQQITVLDTMTYSVTVTDANGCTGTASATTTIEGAIPVSPGAISGPTEGLCNAVNVVYSIDPVPNASFYVWTVPDSTTILSGQGTTSILVNIGNGFSSGEIIVAASNACGQSPSIDPTFITIFTTPDSPGPINGPASGLCNQSSVQFSVDPVAGASFYNWSVPAGYSITSGQGSTTIQVTLGNNPGSICVEVENECGNSIPSCLDVSTSGFFVDAGDCKQVMPGVPPLECVNLTAENIGGVSPFTYSWVDQGNVIVGTSQTINVCPQTNTTYTVTVVDASGCTATAFVDVIISNATCKGNKVQVCHVDRNRTKCLRPSQVPGHLAHGDYLGSCSDPNPCGSSSYFIDDTDIIDDQIFELNPLNIAKEGTESDDVLKVYPNPAKDYVFIDLQMFNETTVVIDIFHPVMGLVRSLQIEPNGHDKTEVNLGMLPPGMYIISKRSEDGHRISTKLILAN